MTAYAPRDTEPHDDQGHRLAPPGLHDCVIQLVRQYVPPGSTVVDLCAGTGGLSLRLAAEGYRMTNVDIDTGWYQAIDIPHVLADLNKPFVDKVGADQFQAAICLEGIEHLENPWDLLRQCRRLLVPGGILILSTPNVECLMSRLLFLLRGGLLTFDRTMVCDKHITPMFSWLLEPNLRQAGFVLRRTVCRSFGMSKDGGWKMRLLHYATLPIQWTLKDDVNGEGRIVVAEAVTDVKLLSTQRKAVASA